MKKNHEDEEVTPTKDGFLCGGCSQMVLGGLSQPISANLTERSMQKTEDSMILGSWVAGHTRTSPPNTQQCYIGVLYDVLSATGYRELNLGQYVPGMCSNHCISQPHEDSFSAQSKVGWGIGTCLFFGNSNSGEMRSAE